MGRESAGAHAQEGEDPVHHVEDQRADGDGAQVDGGRAVAHVADDGDVHHPEQGHGDVGDDAGQGDAEDFAVDVHGGDVWFYK